MSDCEINFMDNDSGNDSDNNHGKKRNIFMKKRVIKKKAGADNKKKQQKLKKVFTFSHSKPNGGSNIEDDDDNNQDIKEHANPEESNPFSSFSFDGGKNNGIMEQSQQSEYMNDNDLDSQYPELGKEITQDDDSAISKKQNRLDWFKKNRMYLKRLRNQKADASSASQISDGIFDPDGVNKDDLIVESFNAPSQKNKGQQAKEIEFSQAQEIYSMPETITFTNTVTYGRIVGKPSNENQDKDAPPMVKYVKGYGRLSFYQNILLLAAFINFSQTKLKVQLVSLYSFQRDGIKKGIKFYGRIVINDDFGTGKSLQALGLSLAYKNEWPLMILCPKFALYMWRYEILKWLPGYDINKIQIIKNESQAFDQQYSITIISYDHAAIMANKIEDYKFKVCIADEAQIFRARESKNGKILINLISNMKRSIVLTGCNLTKKPQEIYSLMRIVRPDIMPGFYEFGYRYCDPRQSFEGIDFTNAGNMIELKQLLDKRIQTIYKRKYIFSELPDRMRQKLEITAETQIVVKIQSLLQNYVKPWEDQHPNQSFFLEMFQNFYENPNKDQTKFLCDPTDDSRPSFQKTLKQIFRDLYDYSGLAKLKVTQDIIDNILENGMRVLIFSYHLTFITSIEDHLSRKTKFLFLGKNVDDDYKQDICDKFNNEDEYKAVLIDLSEDLSDIKFNTPNTIILFAETFWNTLYIERAEKMIDTPGQKSANNIIYLYGRYTLDEYIYKLLYNQNQSLYSELEPLQLDLQNFRVQQTLGQNYDEIKDTQVNWNTQAFATYTQLTQNQQNTDFQAIDPLAPVQIYQKGNLTLENMFLRQHLDNRQQEYLKEQKHVTNKDKQISQESQDKDSDRIEGSQSDINDEDLVGVMTQKAGNKIKSKQKEEVKEEIKIEEQKCELDDLDDDELNEILGL
ncbi:UNKNOWN [Stylonychia lemnae]|uniref:Helicase ATP-binding domain-containing protein n=1 Tax=Stylonychia lemnae TaxID=5949 RepID=A0A078ABI2_STYLE|nr:UNKNOWN [Stylonychia lemnae]|eukprot:CDW78143.1 UNKNOWN [Stylonychia lemnae]